MRCMLLAIAIATVCSVAAELDCTTNAECLAKGLPLKPAKIRGWRARARQGAPTTTTTYSAVSSPTTVSFPPGQYNFTVNGARGGSSLWSVPGGTGMSIDQVLEFTDTTSVEIVVGSQGKTSGNAYGGGGGGATWVYVDGALQFVAGGGGGSSYTQGEAINAQSGQDGGGSTGQGNAVEGGKGGNGGPVGAYGGDGGGGAGFLTNGHRSIEPDAGGGGQGPTSMMTYAGGIGSSNYGVDGGYGGGGGSGTSSGGGGGGYSGGAGGANGAGGGGGGSFSSTNHNLGTGSFRSIVTGDGSVVVVTL